VKSEELGGSENGAARMRIGGRNLSEGLQQAFESVDRFNWLKNDMRMEWALSGNMRLSCTVRMMGDGGACSNPLWVKCCLPMRCTWKKFRVYVGLTRESLKNVVGEGKDFSLSPGAKLTMSSFPVTPCEKVPGTSRGACKGRGRIYEGRQGMPN